MEKGPWAIVYVPLVQLVIVMDIFIAFRIYSPMFLRIV
jgi:hypothetical protein